MRDFDVGIATKYGLIEAVIYEYFKACIGNEMTVHVDGKRWVRASVRELCESHPFFTKKQIRTALEHLVKEGMLCDGDFNSNRMDRTKWYAIGGD